MGSSHRDASISNDKSGHRKLIDGTAGEALDTLETLKAKIVKTIISGHTWDSHAGQMDTTEKDNSLTTINLTTKVLKGERERKKERKKEIRENIIFLLLNKCCFSNFFSMSILRDSIF